MAAQTMLEQVAKQLNIDLDAVKKAQIRAQALDGLARATWQVIQAWDDECIEAIDIRLEFDENGQATKLVLGVGSRYYDVPIADIVPSQSQVQSQVQSQSQAKQNGKGNWDSIIPIAEKYGVFVSSNEARALSWYLGNIIKRIVKQNPEAKNDAELVALAQKWLNEANNAQARGKTLADLGLA